MDVKNDFALDIDLNEADRDTLRSIIQALLEKISNLESGYKDVLQQNEWLMEQLKLIKHNKFKGTSESATEDVLEQLSLLFDAIGMDTIHEEGQEEETETVHSYTRKRRSGSVHDTIPDDIPVETHEHGLPEDERICPQCGNPMEVVGKEVHESLKIIPAKVVLVRDIYYNYACQNCSKNDISTPFVETPRDPVIIPGSFASPEAVAFIMTQKFVMGSPLYRQEQDWSQRGILLSRQTMSNWILNCSETWLTPIYNKLKERLLLNDIIHADETTLQVLREPGKSAKSTSYMWLYRTGQSADSAIVIFEYQPDRQGIHPKEFLSGFHGYLQTDGYSGYNCVEGVIHVGCFAHAKRKFHDAVIVMAKGENTVAAQGEAFCSGLFSLERSMKNCTPEERYRERLKREKPMLDGFLAWVETKVAPAKSKIGIALNYVKNQWEYLNNYLLDGRLEISNNLAERTIKTLVISRKNFLFANTPRGARGGAVILSIIETAKANGLDPFRYLCYIFKKAPALSLEDENWAEKLLPENAPEGCRPNKKAE